MFNVKSLKYIYCLIMLTVISLFCSVINAASQTMYTAQNIWYQKPEKIMIINHQAGKILPVGTEVKKITARDGRRPYIKFVTVNDDKQFVIYITKKYYKKTSMEDFKNRLFTTKNFSQLTEGLTPSEIQGIKAGKVYDGMSKRAVLINFGYPPEHKTPSLDSTKWVFWKNRFKSVAVNFNSQNLVQTQRKPNYQNQSPAYDQRPMTAANTYQKTIPQIIITRPAMTRGLKISKKKIIIEGQAIDPDGIYEVLVNGKEAALNASGVFKAEVLLGVGTNDINILVTDTQNTIAQKYFALVREGSNIALSSKNKKKRTPSLTRGKYHALLIAVQDYAHPSINDLDQPIKDAKALEKVLVGKYTFNRNNVYLLKNPDRGTIISHFEKLSNKVGPDDSCLIFFAGHGYWDKRFKQGYWFPSDATRNNRSNWLSNSTIVDFIRGINSSHTLLVADSCFSGGIFKTRKAFSSASPAINELFKLPSRKALTSGTLNEVPDKSVFVEYLVKRLDRNKENYLSAEQLFVNFRTAVINNSPINQVPQFGEIRQTGDEGGDFIFTHR